MTWTNAIRIGTAMVVGALGAGYIVGQFAASALLARIASLFH